MTVLYNDVLDNLSKEDLIEIIKQYRHTTDIISILLVEVSKLHITKEHCLDTTRWYLSELDYNLKEILEEK